MKVKEGLYYSKDHEWLEVNGDVALLGITDFAQHNLGDIVFVELPEEGDTFDAEEAICVVESVKAASDVYTPVSCEVIEGNEKLDDEPKLLNENPYDAYICKVKLSDLGQLEELMNSEEYKSFIEED